MLQERPVPQAFSYFTQAVIGAPSMSSRRLDAIQKRVARTLSRGFWQ
jgi:hypothetical protein